MQVWCFSTPRHKGSDSEHGVILLLFALSLTVVMGIIALCIDIGRSMDKQTVLQHATDAAALQAAKAISQGKSHGAAEDAAKKLMTGNLLMSRFMKRGEHLGAKIEFFSDPVNPQREQIRVSLQAPQALSFASAAGISDGGATITAQSDAAVDPPLEPTSFLIAIDVSETMKLDDMQGHPKIDGLREALRTLIDKAPMHQYQFALFSSMERCEASVIPPFVPQQLEAGDCDDDDNPFESSVMTRCLLDKFFEEELEPDGGTAIACGISRIAATYENESGQGVNFERYAFPGREIILITDGYDNFGKEFPEHPELPPGLPGSPAGNRPPGVGTAADTLLKLGAQVCVGEPPPFVSPNNTDWNLLNPETNGIPLEEGFSICTADELRNVLDLTVHAIGFGFDQPRPNDVEPQFYHTEFLQRLANTEIVHSPGGPAFDFGWERGQKDIDGARGKVFFAPAAEVLTESLLEITLRRSFSLGSGSNNDSDSNSASDSTQDNQRPAGSGSQSSDSASQSQGIAPLRRGPALQQEDRPRLTGIQPRLTGVQPKLTGIQPRLTGIQPKLTGSQPKLTGSAAK